MGDTFFCILQTKADPNLSFGLRGRKRKTLSPTVSGNKIGTTKLTTSPMKPTLTGNPEGPCAGRVVKE